MGNIKKKGTKKKYPSSYKKKRKTNALVAYRKAVKEGTWVPKEKKPPPLKSEVPPHEASEGNEQPSGSWSDKSPEQLVECELNASSSVGDPQEDVTTDNNETESNEPESEGPEEPEFELRGRRIVDVAHLLRQLQLESGQHEPLECGFADMRIKAETRVGFVCTLTLECEYCDTVARVTTEDPSRVHGDDVDSRAVEAVVSTLQGDFSRLQAITTAMDIPCMGSRMWRKGIKERWRDGHDSLLPEMMSAGAEEVRLAREAGRVGTDGTAIVPVVCDASWVNRCYRVKIGFFGSASVVSAIVGYHTRRLLHVAMLHKYCTVCAAASAGHIAAGREHRCSRRWTNVAALMDPACLADGFRLAPEIHGCKYGQLIGDRDGTIRRMLLETQPYGPEFLITPVESVSDLLRQYTTTLTRLAATPSVAKPLRDLLRKNLRRLRVTVVMAIKRRKAQRAPAVMCVSQLADDIANVPFHVFGDHRQCAAGLCGDSAAAKEPMWEVLQSVVFGEVAQAAHVLAQAAHKLLLDVECNISEKYNMYVVEALSRGRVVPPGGVPRKVVNKRKKAGEEKGVVENGAAVEETEAAPVAEDHALESEVLEPCARDSSCDMAV